MAENLFEDSTMSFGEHIEELRVCLWRAIKGVGIALMLMTFVGQEVVDILARPLRVASEDWFIQAQQRRLEQLRSSLAVLGDDRRTVDLPMTIGADAMDTLRQTLGIEKAPEAEAAPLTVNVHVPFLPLLEKMSQPILTLSGSYLPKTLSAQEAFMMYFMAAMGAAIVLSSPWVFWQLYGFVKVGLYAHERRFVNLTLPFTVGLFLAGVAGCYFLMLPIMLQFFLGVNSWMDLQPEIRISEWVGFAVMLMLLCGAVFQMPVVMLTLERVGFVTYEQLADKRRLAILVNFSVAAVVTPADPTSFLFLAIPMCALYEIGLLAMKYFQRRNPFSVPDVAFADAE